MADVTPAAPAAPVQAPAPSGDPAADPSKAVPVDPVKPAEPPTPTDPAKPAEPVVVAPVIPDKYEFKAPEGMQLDTALIDAVSPLFKELSLTQESASKLIDAYNNIELKKEADFKVWMKDQAVKHQAAVRQEWGHETDAKLGIAQRGIARFLSPELKTKIDESGLGNIPEFIKAFYQIGLMVSEDTPPPGAPNGSGKSAAQVLYGP